MSTYCDEVYYLKKNYKINLVILCLSIIICFQFLSLVFIKMQFFIFSKPNSSVFEKYLLILYHSQKNLCQLLSRRFFLSWSYYNCSFLLIQIIYPDSLMHHLKFEYIKRAWLYSSSKEHTCRYLYFVLVCAYNNDWRV